MLDINRIRENPEEIRQALQKRLLEVDFTQLLADDREFRRLTVESDNLKARRNKVSDEIPKLKKEGADVAALIAEMKTVGAAIKELDTGRAELHDRIESFLKSLPNIPAPDVAAGGKENNQVLRCVNTKPEFAFTPRDHIELATRLGLIDYERGVKLGGNGFWLYRGDGARLEWSLLQYFVTEHLKDGYELLLPPHILNWESGVTAGQFPKFVDDVFTLQSGAERSDPEQLKFLLPTAETALINVFRGEILDEEELPKRMFSYTPCYRREAGSYRAAERGMIRGHQFNKVEMFIYCVPSFSTEALAELVGKAERLVADLGLHYQVSQLAAGDCSAAMAKTIDIEVWLPSMNEYKEVSSASNAMDYQARRGAIRYKAKDGGKNAFLHTLNASGLATSRLFPAILEQFQQPDGRVWVPERLREWMGKEFIG